MLFVNIPARLSHLPPRLRAGAGLPREKGKLWLNNAAGNHLRERRWLPSLGLRAGSIVLEGMGGSCGFPSRRGGGRELSRAPVSRERTRAAPRRRTGQGGGTAGRGVLAAPWLPAKPPPPPHGAGGVRGPTAAASPCGAAGRARSPPWAAVAGELSPWARHVGTSACRPARSAGWQRRGRAVRTAVSQATGPAKWGRRVRGLQGERRPGPRRRRP